MSYILDALKKLEHEKTKKSRGDGIINIAGALLENERTKPAGSSGWKMVFVVTVAVLVTFAATWQLLPTSKSKGNVVPPVPAKLPSSVSPARIETPALQPVTPVAPVQITQPAAPSAPRPVVSSPPQTPPAQAPVHVAEPVEDAASILTRQELYKRLKERKGQISAAATIAAPADIKLSGIAYQDERRARRAVVNGFLMQEGGIVSGATITDIFQDRVRFSLAGKSFELSLVSSGAAPGK